MLTHPNCIFRETIFRPLGGAGPSNFNTYYIDQGLLAHTTNGDGVPHKKIKGGTCKIWLKIQGVRAYNFAASGSNVTKLFHTTCREAGVLTWTQLLG